MNADVLSPNCSYLLDQVSKVPSNVCLCVLCATTRPRRIFQDGLPHLLLLRRGRHMLHRRMSQLGQLRGGPATLHRSVCVFYVTHNVLRFQPACACSAVFILKCASLEHFFLVFCGISVTFQGCEREPKGAEKGSADKMYLKTTIGVETFREGKSRLYIKIDTRFRSKCGSV